MATKPQIEDAQDGWGGGWSLHNSLRMAPNQYASAVNVRIVNDGDIASRQGCQRYLATALGSPSPITGGFSWRQATGTTDLLVSNGHLYTAIANSWGGGNGVYFSLVDRGAGLNTASSSTVFTYNRNVFAHFRDGANECVYIADGLASLGGGAKPLSKWDGTTFTPHGVGPSGVALKYIWVYNQRLFGVTGIDQTLYWSGLNNGDSLGDTAGGGGSATVRTFGAQALLGGAAIGNTNFLWHRGAISMFRGTTFDDINIAAGVLGLAGDVGLCSPFCVVPFDGYAFILTVRGAYLLTATGQLTAFEQPNKPDPTVRDTAFQGGMASFGAYNWMAHNVRYQEVWFGSSGTTQNPVFVYNYRFGTWVGKFGYTLPSLTTIPVIWETLDFVGTPQLILGCSDGFPRAVDMPFGTAGEMYLDDVLSDHTGGSAFACSTQCRRLWSDDPATTKQWRETDTAATLGGNTTVLLTPGIQSATQPNTITLAQPSQISNTQPAVYHATTGGPSQYLDLAYSWSSNPKVTLHRVAAVGVALPNRGIAPPVPNIRLSGTIVSDAFDRADNASDLGSTDTGQLWVQASQTWGISGNLAYQSAGGSGGIAIVESLAADCTVSAIVAGSGTEWGLFFRYTNSSNWWRFVFSGGAYFLQKDIAGSTTTVANASASIATNDLIEIVLNGSTITCKQNGANLFAPVTDGQFSTATKHGIGAASPPGTQRWNDFKVTVP